ncbi:WVD2-like protein 7, partial [Tanacetum coccineum]
MLKRPTLLTGISNFDSSQRIVVLHPIKLPPPRVLNLKMLVNERKQGTTQDASKVIDAAAQSSAINRPSVSEDSGTSQMDPPLSKSKLSTDQEVLQPKISRKPATPSFRSSSYGRKLSRIPLSPANYASMHPRKENMLTPVTKNKLQSPTIPSPFTFRTEERAARRKQARKLEDAQKVQLQTTLKVTINKKPMATPSKVFFVDYVVVTSSYDFAYVNLALQAANGVNKTSESPLVKRRMETYVHPSAKLEEKFKEKDAQKVQLQTTLKEKPETELRRLRQSFCFKARPLPSFYNERERPKSPLNK